MSRCSSLTYGFLATLIFAVTAVNSTQYSSNMFLNGEYQNGLLSRLDDEYIPSSPAAAFISLISKRASPFVGQQYLPTLLECRGRGQQCVPKDQCVNGYFTQQLSKAQNCAPEDNVCCTYNPPTPPPTPAPTTPKPFITCSSNMACVAARDCRNGEILSNAVVNLETKKCYEPNVCCGVPSTMLTEDGYVLKTPPSPFTYPQISPSSPTTPVDKDYLPPQTVTPARRPQPQQAQAQPRPQPQQPQAQPRPQTQQTQAQPRPQPQQPQAQPRPKPQQPQPRPQIQPRPQAPQKPQQEIPQPRPQSPAYNEVKPQYQASSTGNQYLPPAQQPAKHQYNPTAPQPSGTQYNPPAPQPSTGNQYLPPAQQPAKPQYNPTAHQPSGPQYNPPAPQPSRTQYNTPAPQPTQPSSPQYNPPAPQPYKPQYNSPAPQPTQSTGPQYIPPAPQPTQSLRPQYIPQAPQPTQSPRPQYNPPAPQPTQTSRPQYNSPAPQPTQSTRPQYIPPAPQPTHSSRPQYSPSAPQPDRPQYTPPAPQPTQQQYLPPAPKPSPQAPVRQPQVSATRPTFTQPPRRLPATSPPKYLPPVSPGRPTYSGDREVQSSNQEKLVYQQKPIRGEDQLSPQIFPPSKFNPSQTQFQEQIAPVLSKCASALVCTPENYCSSIGVISETPVEITPFRVPLTDCTIEESGAAGKCCRDSNYVDPWPVNLAGVCATRNKKTSPKGIKDIDANFAEIPWQAMILKESTKSLLCGGAIIGDGVALTTASCVQGVAANDIRVKAGEWELGSTNEPLNFQLVGVKNVAIHPSFDPNTGSNDMAVLHLNERLQFASHIQPICISDKDPSPSETCITTGWGKQALSIHEEGAIMHVTTTNPVARSDCGADSTGVCSTTNFDACEFDSGSALACGSGSSVLLKGIYSVENACGEGQAVRFIKPDVAWVNAQFLERSKPLLLRV